MPVWEDCSSFTQGRANPADNGGQVHIMHLLLVYLSETPMSRVRNQVLRKTEINTVIVQLLKLIKTQRFIENGKREVK